MEVEFQVPPDTPRPLPTPARVAVASPRTLHYSPSVAPEDPGDSEHSSDSDVEIAGVEVGAALPTASGKEISAKAAHEAEEPRDTHVDSAMRSDGGGVMTSTEADQSILLKDGKRAVPAPEVAPNAEGSEIPSVADKSAPRFRVGDHHISQRAIKQRANRIFTPRADGSLKVSKEIFDEWKQKGRARRTLEEIFKQCGYDPDFWTSFMMF